MRNQKGLLGRVVDAEKRLFRGRDAATAVTVPADGPRAADDWEKGLELFRAERYAECIPHLERAATVARNESNAAAGGRILSHLGTAQYAIGHFDDAADTFAASIEVAPGKPRLHYNLGNALLAADRLEEAKAQYEKALALDPGYPEAQRALIIVMAEMMPTSAAAADDPDAGAAGATSFSDTHNPAEAAAPVPPVAAATAPQTDSMATVTTGANGMGAVPATSFSEFSDAVTAAAAARFSNGTIPPAPSQEPNALPQQTPAFPASNAASTLPSAASSTLTTTGNERAPQSAGGRRRSLDEVEADLRQARQAVEEARRALVHREDAEKRLVEELVGAVHARAEEQEKAIREGTLRAVQDLLTDAARRFDAGG